MFKNLKNDIITFDLETTGVNLDTDKITQIAMRKHTVDGEVIEKMKYIDPEKEIHPEAAEVTGITNEFLKEQEALPFRRYAKAIFGFIDGCDLAGYNIKRFDIPLLIKEFERCDITWDPSELKIVDGCSIYKSREGRTLSDAMQFYCDAEIEDAHDAMGDIVATEQVIMAQLEHYDDLEGDVDLLHEECKFNKHQIDFAGKCAWIDGEPCLTFGKNSGKSLQDVVATDPGFLRWVLTKDFMVDFKRIVEDALNGKFPEYKEKDS